MTDQITSYICSELFAQYLKLIVPGPMREFQLTCCPKALLSQQQVEELLVALWMVK